ncbi:hypothetical protein K435DRAFT_836737 [Dendrothele bispora CBS 962.96]|uniref:Uncharacterized protein n=1 Tax=Dendrothele bispora (strain CBS 962.96) TaxID=1314807 RepID=A0A4V4HH95_DENBC|nr:hypothetical protein K435DRAFT_836737 [Dendrothele bispora CBS 962.96]
MARSLFVYHKMNTQGIPSSIVAWDEMLTSIKKSSWFNFFADEDPTHGTVNYVNKSFALQLPRVRPGWNGVHVKGDDTTWLADGEFRNSFSRCWLLAVPCNSEHYLYFYVYLSMTIPLPVSVPVPISGFHYLLLVSRSKRGLGSSVLFQTVLSLFSDFLTSVRISRLFILDINRAPWGCAIWSAWWTVGRGSGCFLTPDFDFTGAVVVTAYKNGVGFRMERTSILQGEGAFTVK